MEMIVDGGVGRRLGKRLRVSAGGDSIKCKTLV